MPQLGRFDYFVQDILGTVVAGCSVTVYREGATVQGDQSGSSPFAVNVRHAGKILTGDGVFVNTATGTTYSAARTSDTVITLSGFVGTINVSNGDRLTPSGTQPTLYSDDQGGTTTGNPLTTNGTGRVQCWIEYGAYDFIVSGGGAITTAFTSQVSPTEAPAQIRYAAAFPGTDAGEKIANAIADLPSTGGVVDARGLDGTQTFAANPFGSAPQGTLILLGAGTYTTTAQIVVPDRTTIRGVQKRQTIIKADATFGATPLVRLGPGSTGRLFDMRLERMYIHCNDLAGTTGVYSTQVNEGSGVFNCLVAKYRSVGIDIAASGGDQPGRMIIQDSEVIGSTNGATSGIRFNNIDVGSSIENVTVNMDAGGTATDAIDLTSASVYMANIHIEKHTNGVHFKSGASGTCNDVSGLTGMTSVIKIAAANAGGVALFNITPSGTTNAVEDLLTSRTVTTSSRLGYYCLGADGTGNAKACFTSSNLAAGYEQLATALIYKAPITFTNADTTPTVGAGNVFKENNSAPTNITVFDDGHAGQEITVIFATGNTTLVHSASLRLNGAANITPTANDVIRFVFDGGTWFMSSPISAT